jgi:hypothetical protein
VMQPFTSSIIADVRDVLLLYLLFFNFCTLKLFGLFQFTPTIWPSMPCCANRKCLLLSYYFRPIINAVFAVVILKLY